MAAFKSAGIDPKSANSISRLPNQEGEAVKNLISQLAEYGLFVADVGELECWLQMLHAKGLKGEWLADAFDEMGSDPTVAGYVTPSSETYGTSLGR